MSPWRGIPLQDHLPNTALLTQKSSILRHLKSYHAVPPVQIWDNCVNIHASYDLTTINNVNRSTGIHTFHIIDICSWTSMSSTFHMSHYTTTVVYIQTSHYYTSKSKNDNFYLACYYHICVNNKNVLECHICQSICSLWDNCVNIYAPLCRDWVLPDAYLLASIGTDKVWQSCLYSTLVFVAGHVNLVVTKSKVVKNWCPIA